MPTELLGCSRAMEERLEEAVASAGFSPWGHGQSHVGLMAFEKDLGSWGRPCGARIAGWGLVLALCGGPTT